MAKKKPKRSQLRFVPLDPLTVGVAVMQGRVLLSASASRYTTKDGDKRVSWCNPALRCAAHILDWHMAGDVQTTKSGKQRARPGSKFREAQNLSPAGQRALINGLIKNGKIIVTEVGGARAECEECAYTRRKYEAKVAAEQRAREQKRNAITGEFEAEVSRAP